MSFDMIEAMTLIAREKNIEFDAVLETLEAGLMAAAKKKYAFTDNITFRFDRKNNELLMIATKRVVEQVADPNVELTLAEAKDIDPEAELGDEVDIYIDYEVEFGRNAIAAAKQILIQKVREAERDRIYDEYIDKVGTLISGVVQQVDKGNVIVNLGRGEGIMPIKEQIPREKFRQGDRIRAFIVDVQKVTRGPQIILSRVSNDFLRKLFELEVPEIYERVIEIKALAREPGERAKVAVYSSDDRIDPVGACVGIKGVRVQAIVRELNNERIDIVPWSGNPELFVTRALAPAKVVNIDVDDTEQKMTVAVEDDKLSLAIGRSGQNARLASKLTGWKVNIMSETEYNEMKHREAEMLVPVGRLDGVGPKLSERLADHNIGSVQRLANATVEALVKIEGLGEKTAETLIEKAKVFVAELEAEYERKKAMERAAEAAQAAESKAEEKLRPEDVFEEDEDFVTEVDDQAEATAPSMEDLTEDEDENEDESARKDG
ncbi:MAG TPA: transcription termination factor NusA [candidate division Zixibacteria bacterium]|nr:transcription termination factor NusA [candidate division Zixibacteria bacterium]MDD4918679.1 transcription termination factor NusA [candidate division Zixibacteria bacterium]MDM7973094.1 transcription termination factor NusA [candidate division Zixibacteria bacterium]HOD66976.1 transcription termination factor NusA [candidate division Zixibacteria bacterium]HPM38503.1 transcription termination factor NusA [candidate division Zixibacteria bacterium]